MIKSILITNYLGESVELELRFPEKSGFLVERVDGLSPAKANINATELATKDGSSYNSARLNSRNIVFKLRLMEHVTVEDMRQKSYRYFPIKKKIEIQIVEDNRICNTHGYVETNEIDIFSKEVSTVISVICPDPYFYASSEINTMLSSITSLFEFPFSNESLTEDLIEMGEIVLGNLVTIQYDGEADTGVVFHIHALGPATNIMLYNSVTLETMVLSTDFVLGMLPNHLEAGDDIIISTVKGNKFVLFLRDGEYYNILNSLDRDADWLQLTSGENNIGFTAETGAENLQIRIEHRIVYEGV